MKKCYEVHCKGGHVGKGYYYPMVLYIEADSGKEAAQIAREAPRVKHDHKDCIQNVRVISWEDMMEGRQRNRTDGYYSSHSKQEMLQKCPEYIERRIPEKKAEPKCLKVPLSYRNRKKFLNHYAGALNQLSWDFTFDMMEGG